MVGEGGLVADKGDTDVDAGEVDKTGVGETLVRYEWILRCGKRTCTHRSDLENTFGTETETGMENLEKDGAGVGLDEGAGLDKATGADLVDDELGLIDGFEVELVFGRCEVSDGQLWSFGKRCWGQNSLWHFCVIFISIVTHTKQTFNLHHTRWVQIVPYRTSPWRISCSHPFPAVYH
jgi:hypothetical protein